MKLTVFGMFTIEGTEKELADYTSAVMLNLKAAADKQESEEAQNAVDSLIQEMFGKKQ